MCLKGHCLPTSPPSIRPLSAACCQYGVPFLGRRTCHPASSHLPPSMASSSPSCSASRGRFLSSI